MIFEELKPGVRESDIVARANQMLYEMGSDGCRVITLFPAEELPIANPY